MNKYVVIYGLPVLAFYDINKPNYSLCFPHLLSITDIIKDLASQGGEVANITVNIDNIQGNLTRYLHEWFGKRLEYYLDDSLEFSGTISSIQSSETLSLTVIM